MVGAPGVNMMSYKS